MYCSVFRKTCKLTLLEHFCAVFWRTKYVWVCVLECKICILFLILLCLDIYKFSFLSYITNIMLVTWWKKKKKANKYNYSFCTSNGNERHYRRQIWKDLWWCCYFDSLLWLNMMIDLEKCLTVALFRGRRMLAVERRKLEGEEEKGKRGKD